MFKYSISLLFIFITASGLAQSENPKDTITRKYAYGLRVGIDLSRPTLSFLNDNYTGLELVGDFRLTDRWWLAAELGNEERTQEEILGESTLYTYTASGSYLKLGGDYNTYTNWFGMRNQIHIGGRFAFSTFSQNLENFRFFDSNRFFSPDEFVLGSSEAQNFDGLNASWLEFVIGMKAEVIKNIYVGISARLAHLVTNKEPDNFKNLWIPGFNKVTEGAKWGVGFNYSLSYFLPLYKKVKKKEEKLED
jgi:hypothetical protein